MKRAIAFFIAVIFFSNICIAQSVQKTRIAVVATGGTIAGAGSSSTNAKYTSAQVTINALLEQVPGISEELTIIPIQISQIPSQNMNFETIVKLSHAIDSLFENNIVDGVVVTHGTDTMEETAYFLNLTVPHPNPIVLVGSMRPSTSISADGPMNLFNAIKLAANPDAFSKGVMVAMNDFIYGADDIIKSSTVNVNAMECPNYGPLGVMRSGTPFFFRNPITKNTINSDFNINNLPAVLPRVDIVNSYVSADDVVFKAVVAAGAEGVVISGVGHGNATNAIMSYAADVADEVIVVRSSRIFTGGVTVDLEDEFEGQVAAWYKSPQKARILLMLALTKTKDVDKLQQYFIEY